MGAAAMFRLLGPVDLLIGSDRVLFGGPRSQAMLAALLLEADRFVPLDRLVEAVWADDPPASARTQAQNRISGLRQTLQSALDRPLIESSGSSYVIRLDDVELDVTLFDNRVRAADKWIAAGAVASGVVALEEALALWRGRACEGLDTPRMVSAAQRLDDARIGAHETLIDAYLRLGRHRETLAPLFQLCSEHPLRERFVGQLMTALHRCSRQADALAVFEQTRDRLADELGIDPSQELIHIRDAILRDDPSLAGARPPVVAATETNAAGTRPVRLLPRANPDFVGRGDELAALRAAYDSSPDEPTVVAVTGTAGVGKTALALHWGHQSRDRFPDGQLYVNLRGYGPGNPLRPVEALATLLQALDVAPERMPQDEDTAANVYRSVLSGRRVLVVLDNAATAEQVRPLLPAHAGAMTLITSRDNLTGLTAIDGAARMPLRRLVPADGVTLLRRMLGDRRVDADTLASEELAGACAYLPLALRIAAAQLHDQPHRSVSDYVAELRRAARLDILQVPDDSQAAVRTAFDRSCALLAPAAAQLFQLFGASPAPEITGAAAAAVAGISTWHAAELLDQLASAHLIERVGAGRYGMHDLLREYAREQCARNESGVAEAMERFFAHYVGKADAAARVAFPTALRLPMSVGQLEPYENSFADRAAALDWLDAERAVLVSAASAAASHALPDATWQLAQALRQYFWLRRATIEWRDTELAAIDAARSPLHRAASAYGLGLAEINSGRYGDAVEHFRVCARISQEERWTPGEASAFGSLGIALGELGRLAEGAAAYRRALELNEKLDRIGSQANNLGNLGLLEIRAGNFAAASVSIERALQLHRSNGGSQHYGVLLSGYGQASRHLGRLDAARGQLLEAVAFCREMGDDDNEVIALAELVALELDCANPAAAADLATQAVRLSERTQDPDIRSVALAARACALLGVDPPSALADAEDSLARAREGANAYVIVHALLASARACQALGDAPGRRAHAADAMRMAEASAFGYLAEQASALLRPGQL